MNIARQAGNIRSVNITMLGALIAHLGLDPDAVRSVLKSRLPRKTWPVNLKAFRMGMNALKEPVKVGQ
jgi:indolepyruvate ferredoxin oxidoreductase beta subunit